MNATLKLRRGQRRLHTFVDQYRLSAFLARRQYGKTTTVAGIALKKMMKQRGHTVVFGSAKLSLSREIVRKEAQIMQQALAGMREGTARLRLIDNGQSGSSALPDNLSADDFADIFEAQRLEFRFFHSNNASDYSRTKVVALLPDTVGETGDLIMDEVGRVKNFREVAEAVWPIISSNPDFRLILTTTPPPDDSHYSFELLAPPIDAEFKPNPEGNTYRSELGVQVLRLDAFDAAADGVPLYDDETGEPISPEGHRRRAHDKDAWDRNYGVKFIIGGTAACGLIQLETAQRRGIGECACYVIEDDQRFDEALLWLAARISDKPVGIGVDWATTEKAISNPSSVSVIERHANEFITRACFVWKTGDPDLAEHRLVRIVETINARPKGGRARRLCQDATNEKFFCLRIRKKLRALVPVENVVASEGSGVMDAYGQPMNYKQHLGSQYVAVLDDNHLTLPPERYIKADHRLVKKEKGTFICDSSPTGQHGDTFDSGKLAVHALVARGDGKAKAAAVGSAEGAST